MTHLRRQTILAVAVVAVGLVLPARSWAFHSGGAGDCGGCHSMHNSVEGAAVANALPQYQAGPYLLKASDQGSVCLNCHNVAATRPVSYCVATDSSVVSVPGAPPSQLTPGGDFAWLKKTYRWTGTAGGPQEASLGERHGHNVVATDYGFVADGTLTRAPGGDYPASSLTCTSCHDPHGKYRRLASGAIVTSGLPILDSGSYTTSPAPVPNVGAMGVYRMLGGVGYQPRSLNGNFAFANPPPDALAPGSYNRSEALTQTRVAYGRGMSEWCVNCHTSLLVGAETSGMKDFRHPAGPTARLPQSILTNYTAYVKTGVLTNQDSTRSYWSLVPFEEGTGDYATLRAHAQNDDSALNGPDLNSTVSCITCHRAHASGFDGMTRFRVGNEFITVDGGGVAAWPDPSLHPAQAQGRTAAETQKSYYDRPATQYAPFQTTLCNKCHVKD